MLIVGNKIFVVKNCELQEDAQKNSLKEFKEFIHLSFKIHYGWIYFKKDKFVFRTESQENEFVFNQVRPSMMQ